MFGRNWPSWVNATSFLSAFCRTANNKQSCYWQSWWQSSGDWNLLNSSDPATVRIRLSILSRSTSRLSARAHPWFMGTPWRRLPFGWFSLFWLGGELPDTAFKQFHHTFMGGAVLKRNNFETRECNPVSSVEIYPLGWPDIATTRGTPGSGMLRIRWSTRAHKSDMEEEDVWNTTRSVAFQDMQRGTKSICQRACALRALREWRDMADDKSAGQWDTLSWRREEGSGLRRKSSIA